jgi:hypothetical protein
MTEVVAIVELGRNKVTPPFGIRIGKVLELGVRHEVLVDIKIVDGNRVLWNLILKQLCRVYVKELLKTRDFRSIDSNLDGASTHEDHGI